MNETQWNNFGKSALGIVLIVVGVVTIKLLPEDPSIGKGIISAGVLAFTVGIGHKLGKMAGVLPPES